MILVTGSSGFIGTNVTRYFINKGENVVGLDLVSPAVNFPIKDFTFHKCDLTDMDAVLNAFKNYNPKFVIHLAFVTHRKDIYSEFMDDARITLNVLEAARKQRVERYKAEGEEQRPLLHV